MKAIVLTKYGSPADLELREVEKPIPKDNEVLIKVHAASVNDWDLGLVTGKPSYIRLFNGFRTPKTKIPGVDVAGRIEAVGNNLKKFKPGDAVYSDLSECGFGAFAEYVCAPENALTSKSEKMTFVEAAALPHAAALALQGLRDIGQLQPGQKLLINGAGGGVGTLGAQIAKALGVENIAGVDHASKLDMMKETGFEQVIDYQKEDFTKLGKRYDLVLDTKTTRSTFSYPRALKPKGRYVTVGGTTRRLLQAFLFGKMVGKLTEKDIRIVALKTNKDLDFINELFDAGKLKPVIDGPYKLEEVANAIQYFGEGKHKGKVVINLQD